MLIKLNCFSRSSTSSSSSTISGSGLSSQNKKNNQLINVNISNDAYQLPQKNKRSLMSDLRRLREGNLTTTMTKISPKTQTNKSPAESFVGLSQIPPIRPCYKQQISPQTASQKRFNSSANPLKTLDPFFR